MTASMRKAQQTRSLVAAWFDFLPAPEAPVARKIHQAIHEAVPDLSETVRQGNLLLSMNGEPLLALAPAPGCVDLLIFNGSEIEATLGPLEAVARRQRLARFQSVAPVDVARVRAIAHASAQFCRRHQPVAGG